MTTTAPIIPETLTVCGLSIARTKGEPHVPVETLRVTLDGIENDHHAGPGPRQVSLMHEDVVRDRFPEAPEGALAGRGQENILLSGGSLAGLRILDTLDVGSATLEITGIGSRVNDTGTTLCSSKSRCLASDFGIFARVIHGGEIETGCRIQHQQRLLRAHIITVSDRASTGAYEDKSGPAVRALLEAWCSEHHWSLWAETQIIPDEQEAISKALKNARQSRVDVVITTGGTGVGPRDITPDVVAEHVDKVIPGIMDAIRLKYGATMPMALTSRSVAAVMGSSLVYTLPGSAKAVPEYLEEIFKTMEHMIILLKDVEAHGS